MIYSLLEIIGSLGVFLFGMKTMSEGIQRTSGERLHAIMNFMTGNRFAAVFTGFAITAIIQSSSATTVMIVSFVDAALLSLEQAIGVIMGANIGTTVTGWVVAMLGFKFNIITIALPTIGIGFPMLIIRKWNKEAWGEILTGFGVLLLGLNYLKLSVPDIQNNPELLQFLSNYTDSGFTSLIMFILVGAVLTVLVQSSSAAMAITLTMAHAGWIDIYTAAAIVLGENIGTTITAFLASIGAQVNARRAARAHTMFNLLGVLWMLCVFKPFLHFVEIVVPGDMFTPAGIPAHLAMFHTMFNLVNTCLLIGFVSPLEKLAVRLVRDEKQEEREKYTLKYLSSPLHETGEIKILEAKMELSKMQDILQDMFSSFLDILPCSQEEESSATLTSLEKMEEYTDQMQEQITRFLIECSRDELNKDSATNVNLMIRIAHEMERIADSCFTLGLLSHRRNKKAIALSSDVLQNLTPYTDLVQQFMAFNKSHLNAPLSEKELLHAYRIENAIDALRKKLKKNAQTRLQKGADVKGELLYIDMLQHIEHIGDSCLNISQALRQYH
ncbi:Na/Pi cotransporter [candidate division KSB3 bacterium]|uniref:Na/Pi cotransporter n=1 Tax=candidate division KSB3 bacterium TaxID=2044937 RepID=A0A2G6E6Z1_9BACT|nr:MAG: Na/Pi cotransporter [candidate division KSB3 bacterium]PIE30240.1 MAG: Na/Pi cotransporter [candidate division KSB3 bacterium]